MVVKSIPAVGDIIKWRSATIENISEVDGYMVAYNHKTHEEYYMYVVYVYMHISSGGGYWNNVQVEPSQVVQIYRKEVL